MLVAEFPMGSVNKQYEFRCVLEQLRHNVNDQHWYFVEKLNQYLFIEDDYGALVGHLSSYDFIDLKRQFMGLRELLAGYDLLPAIHPHKQAVMELQSTLRALDHTLALDYQRSKDQYVELASQLFARLNPRNSVVNKTVQQQGLGSHRMRSKPLLVPLNHALQGTKTSPYQTFAGPQYSIKALAISPDGRIVASGDGQGQVFVWAFPSGKQLNDFYAHRAAITCLAINSEGVLISGSRDTKLNVWENLLGSYAPRTSLVPSENSEMAKKRADMKHIMGQFYDPRLLPEKNCSVFSLALSGPNNVVAAYEDNCLRAWDISTGVMTSEWLRPLGRPETPWGLNPEVERGVRSIVISPDGVWEALGGYQDIFLHKKSMEEGLRIRPSMTGYTNLLTFSPVGNLFVYSVGSIAKAVHLRKMNGRCSFVEGLHYENEYRSSISAGAITKDGFHLMCGYEDGRLYLWNLDNCQQPVVRLDGHNGRINSVVMAPKGGFALTAGDDKVVKVWNLREWGVLA